MTWPILPEWLVFSAAEAAAWLATWLVQSTALILVGLSIARLLHPRGAALQSAVYRATLVGVLACPFASLVLAAGGVPGWSWRVPEAWLIARGPHAHEASPPQAMRELRNDSALAGTAVISDDGAAGAPYAAMYADDGVNAPFPAPTHNDSFELQRETNGAAPASGAPPETAGTRVDADATDALERLPVGPHPTATALAALSAVLVWLAGAAVLLGRLAWTSRGMRAVIRTSAPAGGLVSQAAREVAVQLGVRPPRVVVSPLVTSPCLYGILRPTLLLPEDTAAGFAHLQQIFAHELAHLRRGDCAWHLVHRVVTAILWPQPLAWLLARRLERAAEEVCDDYAMQHGADRTRYADTLVEIAERTLPPLAASASAVSMVSLRSTLAHRIIRILDPTRRLSTRAGGLAVALVVTFALCGTLLVGLLRAASQGEAERPVATNDATDTPRHKPETGDGNSRSETSRPDSASDEVFTIRGHVVDPDGNPAAGAMVRVLPTGYGYIKYPLLDETTTEENGSFEVHFRKSQFTSGVGHADPWRQAVVVAIQEGFGPAWTRYHEIAEVTEPTLQLARDDIPIDGRLVDLEGRPLAGVTVEAHHIRQPKEDDLSEWHVALQQGGMRSITDRHLGRSLSLEGIAILGPVRTDNDGRFRITGIGRERVAILGFHSDQAAYTTVHAATRHMESVTQVKEGYFKDTQQYVGAEFSLSLPPTKPIHGTVRDAETGEPIAGVAVESWVMAGTHLSHNRVLRTVSDEEGRFALLGMPKGEGNEFIAIPNDDQPYFMRTVEVPDTEGLAPVRVDIKLHRGIWITGRVTDQVTGEPLIAHLYYMPFLSNSHAQALPEFRDNSGMDGFQWRYESKPDGTFKIVGLPGPALVGAQSSARPYYRTGAGMEDLAADEVNEHGDANTWSPAIPASRKWPHVVKKINPPADAETAAVDLELDPGRSLTLVAIDPQGEPVEGLDTIGHLVSDMEAIEGSPGHYRIMSLGPEEQRTAILLNSERGLGQVIRIEASQSLPEVLTVQLEPCATITGRLFDDDGVPIAAAVVRASVNPAENFPKELVSTTTDSEGRFRYENVPVGCTYRLQASSLQLQNGFDGVALEVEVRPGETTDLGDVTLGEQGGQTASDAAVEPIATGREHGSEQRLIYTGRVLTPSGEPAVGAKIHFAYWPPDASLRRPLAETGADGRFRIELNKRDFGETSAGLPWATVKVIATKDGYGFGWTVAAALEKTGNATERIDHLNEYSASQLRETLQARDGDTIRLAQDDVPITGRIVDIEGRPVAGATIRTFEFWGNDQQDLTSFVEAARGDKADYYALREKAPIITNTSLREDILPTVKTDADGRFTLAGIGRGRIAQFQIEGPQIETKRVYARTQVGERLDIPHSWESPEGGTDTFHGSRFTHVAGPARPVVGVVRDKDTGQPIPGATVVSQKLASRRLNGIGADFIRAVTDAEGRYALTGLPIGENRIGVIPPDDEPYLPVDRTADTRNRKAPLTIEFELQRGVWITGVAMDKENGQPLSGRVEYFTFFDNPHFHRGHFGRVDLRFEYRTDRDGRFRIPGLPGRGIIAFLADDWQAYPRGAGYKSIDGADPAGPSQLLEAAPHYCVPINFHIVRQIEPAPDAESFPVTFELAAGKQVRGKIVDPDGEPVEGAYYAGRTEGLVWRAMDGKQFVVEALEPGKPRHLIFYHQESGLAATYLLEDATDEELTIELQASGTIRGRVLDAAGTPQPRVAIISWDGELSLMDPYEKEVKLRAPLPPTARNEPQHETDDEGRFEIRGLIPGLSYNLAAHYRGETRNIEQFASDVTVSPGEVKDLGDLPFLPRDGSAEQDRHSDETGAVSDAESPKAHGGSDAVAADTTSQSLTANSTSAEPVQIQGTVLDPDGNPLAGATVRVVDAAGGNASQLVQSNAGGEFRVTFDKSAVTRPEWHPRPWTRIRVVADAEGYGPAWIEAEQLAADRPVRLQLVQDIPIRGQIVDLEGGPVAGASVTMWHIYAPKRGNLDTYLSVARDGEYEQTYLGNDMSFLAPAALAPTLSGSRLEPADRGNLKVMTDEDGRFELGGIGRERVVTLFVEGPEIESGHFKVVTRQEIEEKYQRKELGRDARLMLESGAALPIVHPATFVHAAGPSRPVRGVVRDRKTKEPLAGVAVSGDIRNRPVHASAVTDENGRYELRGLAAEGMLRLNATPRNVPYLGVTRDWQPIAATGPREDQNFELVRGITVRGRVVNRETGAPVKARVEYLGLRYNPHVQQMPDRLSGYNDAQTGDDGIYELTVLPGPGLVAVYASSKDFKPATAEEFILPPREIDGSIDTVNMGSISPERYFAARHIAPDPDGEPLVVDFKLRPARPLDNLFGGALRGVDEAIEAAAGSLAEMAADQLGQRE